MVKVVVASLRPTRPTKSKRTKRSAAAPVTLKRVLGPDGRLRKLWALDAESLSFGDDLQYVFSRNVSKARRANKRIVGSSDVVAHKD